MPRSAEPEPTETPAEPDAPEQVEADEAPADEPEREPLPAHKPDLVFLAIERGIPSYEAWDMTVPELTARLES